MDEEYEGLTFWRYNALIVLILFILILFNSIIKNEFIDMIGHYAIGAGIIYSFFIWKGKLILKF